MGEMEAGRVARISHVGRTLEVREGGDVHLGRGSTSDVVVGAEGPEGEPEDLGVSRSAATVSVRDGRLWVRNDSSSQPLYLVPETGSTRVLEGKDEIASLPGDEVTIQFRGRIRTHEVQVELLGESPPDEVLTSAAMVDGTATQYLLEFTPAERRILTALCEPLLVDRGDKAKPASYAQAAERVFLSRSRVENCVADLVKKFASAGVPNLEGPEAKDHLCRYAVRSGSIVQADLRLLEA
jgi:hypothetical protein